MNMLQTIQTTMSSREISELVESRHDSVKRTIERCAERGLFTLPPLVETSFIGTDGRGQTVDVYHLDKRSSLIVVAQLSPEFTARIVDRWQELEARAMLTQRVARAGWNGKGMWLKLVPNSLADYVAFQHEALNPLPWIGMKTADECFVPWLASQTDMLAEDWQIVS